jgi:glycosyltransferase involved in cell wall biosynthesis
MKIAIYVMLFPPLAFAGTEVATYNIASYLAARGHEVHVFTMSGKGMKGDSQENGFNIHRNYYPKIRLLGGVIYFMKTLLLIHKIDPEIILGQSTYCGFGSLLSGKPYVVWGQGSDIYLPTAFDKIYMKTILKNADALIALTEDMKREMEKLSHRNINVIPNGICIKNFENLSKDKIRNDLKINREQIIILFVGTLRPVKGLKYLLKAFKSIIEAGFNVALVLVGDGVERDQLQRMTIDLNMHQQVYFIGSVSNSLVPEYMAGADIFVLPSLSEGFPVVLLEAMASGLPIISTNVRGIPEIIEDGVNGFIVEPKNPRQIAEKLTILLSSPEMRSTIAKNNIEKAKRYTWRQVIDKLESLFNSVFLSKNS